MYDAGQEPYRALGLTVHEHEILDDESLRTVARAKAQYNKKYREVSALVHVAMWMGEAPGGREGGGDVGRRWKEPRVGRGMEGAQGLRKTRLPIAAS